MGNLLWSSDRPEFVERVAKLAGKTTYRVPVGGRGTKMDQLPDEHAVAVALAYSRQGRDDIGPDVAYCLVLQSDAYRRKVVRTLAQRIGDAVNPHAIRESRQHAAAACDAAWDAVIHLTKGVSSRRPVDCPERAWDLMLLGAIKLIHDSAWDSLAEAERKYRLAS